MIKKFKKRYYRRPFDIANYFSNKKFKKRIFNFHKIKNSFKFKKFKKLTRQKKKFYKFVNFYKRYRYRRLKPQKIFSSFTQWDSRKYFFKIKKWRKDKRLLNKKLRIAYGRRNRWKTKIKFGRFSKTSNFFSNSKFKYRLFNKFKNKKKFKFWLSRHFFQKRRFYAFRIFFFFRKLESIGINVRKPNVNSGSALLGETFFEKYRRFSIIAIKYGWHKFATLSQLKRLKKYRKQRWQKKFSRRKKSSYYHRRFRTKFKKFKKLRWKKKKKRLTAKIFSFLTAKRTYRRIFFLQIFRKRLALYKNKIERTLVSPFSKNLFFSPFSRKKKLFRYFRFFGNFNSNKFFKLSSNLRLSLYFRNFFPKAPQKIKKFRINTINSKFFYSRRRFPKFYIRNPLIQAKKKAQIPLSYFFTRFSKKSNFFFKTFKFKRIRYKKRIRKKELRRFRWFKKIKFYQNKLKKSNFRSISHKLFSVRKKYVKFFAYQGFFRKFARTRFKYRSKRIKFFRYFKKYFSRFHQFTGIPKTKLFSKRKRISKINIFVHIFKSVNNIFVNVSAPRGRTLYSYSAGRTNFRGSKRLSPIAMETMGKSVSLLLFNSKIKKVAVVFHTPVDFLVRALLRGFKASLRFSSFRYHLSKPHNGLRMRASRRILF